MSDRLTEEQQNEAERLVWRVMDGEHEDYIDAHAAFAAICDQADAARRFLALTETGPERACLTHRCWFHPEDRSTVCSLFSWIRQYQGTPEPCEVVSAHIIPADYLTEEGP